MKRVLLCLFVCVLSAGAANAGEDYFVVGVEKPVDIRTLRNAGLLYLADLGALYLLMGNEPALERLDATGTDFRRLAAIEPGDDVFLLRAREFRSEMLYSRVLADLGGGRYLVAVKPREIGDLRSLPFAKERLLPRDFPEPLEAVMFRAPPALSPSPEIQSLVGNVSQDTLTGFISELSGNEPAIIGGTPDTLYTRFSFSPKIERAAEYIYERMEAYGLDVAYHDYVICTHNLFSTHVVDADHAWVVGSSRRIYKTSDGGENWVIQIPCEPLHTFNGVCFVDTLKGWACATGGYIFCTQDGGSTWAEQATPASAILREITFFDSTEGWAVGHQGVTLHTTDGGQTWVDVPSGITTDLYGLHFEAPGRGWACGKYGKILFWDGASWTPQTSGSSDYLLDVHFGDANTGYVVGAGSTILKTGDGGATWVPLSAPAGINPYFNGVCFIDSLEGWVAGLKGTILYTDDGGATWERQPTYTLFGLRWVRFVNDMVGWAVGYGGTVLHTGDGGQTWEGQRRNLPEEDLIAWKNVVGTRPGKVSDQEVIICGHFDSISEDPYNLAPGADDNASGTAAVMEAARVLGRGFFEKTLKFICFSGEEEGLYGSGEYAADAKRQGDDIMAVLNFDMIGYEDTAPEDIDVIGNEPSEWLVDFTIDCANAYVPGLPTLKIIDPTFTPSDHSPFWNAGYDALLAIEDRMVPYPYYHTVNDTIGNLTMAFTTDVTRMGVAAIAELAVPDSAASIAGKGETVVGVIRAYPNPFVGGTSVCFTLRGRNRVEAAVYDVEGRLVRTLLEAELPAGTHEVKWDGRDAEGRRVSPGIYFARLAAGERRLGAKIVSLH